MGRIFIWSDTHFGHERLAERWRNDSERGFDGSVATHNEVLKAAWNGSVTDQDEILILGDVVMGKRREGLEWVAENLNGRKFLSPGNHDKAHSMFRNKSTYEADVAMYAEVFTLVPEKFNGEDLYGDAGRNLVFCHFPIKGTPDHDEDGTRNVIDVWGPDSGDYSEETVFVHGHTHSSKPVSHHMVHVGVDAHPAPIQLHELIALAEISRITQETEG